MSAGDWLAGLSLTEGQLAIGTHCLGRHSMLPLTQAQRVQFTDDHISPSCGPEETRRGQNIAAQTEPHQTIMHPSTLLSHPVDLVPDSAVLHLLHLHIGQTLLAASVAVATPRARAPPLAHHRGVLGRRNGEEGAKQNEGEC